jgi:RNA methyltransferase, TrmH family
VPDITSRQHPLVKAFRTVAAGEADRALIDGWHLLHEAAAAPEITVDVVAVVDSAPTAADAAFLTLLARQRGTHIVTVSRTVMDALSPTRAPSGVAGLIRKPVRHLSNVLTPAPSLVLLAVSMQDPGNTGAIVRAAEAGGATGVVFTGASADPWSWKALRASMGSTFRLPVVRDPDAVAVCHVMREAGLQLLATDPHEGVPMGEADLSRPTALLLGGEGGGLDAALVSAADALLSIPMRGRVESLNVAVAAGVLVYEALRQRAERDRPQRG